MKQALSLLADIANGIFAVLLAGYFSGTEIVWWHFIIGIPLAMSPDLDALPELIRRGRVGSSAGHTHDHRDGLHFPILFLVTGLLLTYLFPFFGLLFIFATVLHFINDLYFTTGCGADGFTVCVGSCIPRALEIPGPRICGG